jgi:hypothetical protein
MFPEPDINFPAFPFDQIEFDAPFNGVIVVVAGHEFSRLASISWQWPVCASS